MKIPSRLLKSHLWSTTQISVPPWEESFYATLPRGAVGTELLLKEAAWVLTLGLSSWVPLHRDWFNLALENQRLEDGRIQGLPQLSNEWESSLGYMRPCPNTHAHRDRQTDRKKGRERESLLACYTYLPVFIFGLLRVSPRGGAESSRLSVLRMDRAQRRRSEVGYLHSALTAPGRENAGASCLAQHLAPLRVRAAPPAARLRILQ